MPDGLSALFWGILTFSLLVVIHEGGHFAAARFFGIKVHEFMIGLPGPALRFHGKKTTYGITAFPLGGYVRIAGMEPGPEEPLLASALATVSKLEDADANDLVLSLGIEEAEADRLLVTLADWDAIEPLDSDHYRYRSRYDASEAEHPEALLDRARSVTYRSLSTWKRIVVLSSGVLMNLMTAILVFTVVLTAWGFYEPTLDVAEVGKGSAAADAGIAAGDRIISLGGSRMSEWNDVMATVSRYEPGDRVAVVVERDGEELSLNAELGHREGTDQPLLGVSPDSRHVRLGPLAALAQSISYIGLTFVAIAGFFNPETFQASISGSSSVIGASYIAAEAAESSPIDYASIVALLSLSLGVINVLPIPPLDGGKIVVEIIERVAKRPLPRRLSIGLSAAGALMLFALIGYLMYADVVRFIING